MLKKLCVIKLTEHGNMENHLVEMENLMDQLASMESHWLNINFVHSTIS